MKIENIDEFSKFFHYSYHLTPKEKIEDIKKLGLIPLCGENSKSIQDYIEAIYFFLNLHRLSDWGSVLFHDVYHEASLIRIDMRGIKNLYVNDLLLGDCYTLDKIGIDYLSILGEDIRPDIARKKELIWHPIKKD